MKNRRPSRRAVFAASMPLAVAVLSPLVQAATPVPYSGTTYTQDFNTLPITGTFTYTGNGPYDVPNNSGGSLAGWQFDKFAGSGTHILFTVDDGALTSGSIYSYGSSATDTTYVNPGNGTTASSDRALGSLASGSTVGEFGVLLTNSTASTNYNTLTLSFTGEEWRFTTAAVDNILAFSYAVGATDIATGSFNSASSLNFAAPKYGSILPAGVTADGHIDGNASGNNVVVTATIPIIGGWAPGQTLALKWSDNNDAGNDQGLGIDDLSFNAGVTVTNHLTWNASGGTGTWDMGITPNWAGDATLFHNGDTVSFDDGHQGTVTIASGGVQPSSTNVTNTTGTYTLHSSDSIGIAGAGNLAKSGAGKLVLSGQNTYSGGTTVTGGTLAIDNNNELGNGGSVTLNGGTLQIAGGGVTLLRTLNIGANGGTFDTNGNDVTYGGTGGSGGSFNGTGNFTKIGGGNLTDNITPQYTGTTSILGGTITYSLGTASPIIKAPATAGGFTGNIVMASPFSLHIAGGLVDGGGDIEAAVTGAWIYGDGSSTTTTINNNIVSDAFGTLGLGATATNTLIVNGSVTGNGAIEAVSGAGIVVLNSTSNSYGGSTSTLIANNISTGPPVAAGVIRIGVNNALPVIADVQFGDPTSASNTTPFNAGAIDLGGHNQTIDSLATYYGVDTVVTNPASSSHYALANGITNSSATLSTLTIDDEGSGASTQTYANPIGAFTALNITGNNNIALTLAGTNSGNLTLIGVSTYTGATTINGGTLTLATGITGYTAPTAPATLYTPISSTGSIANSPVTIGAAGVLDVNATSGAAIGGLNSTSSTAVLDLDNASVLTINGSGTYAGMIGSASGSTGGLAIAAGTEKFTGTTKTLGSLSITGGKLDLGNGNLIVTDTAGSATAIIGYIKAGYDKGAEDGTGIISSAALTQKGTTLGYIDTGTQLKIKYTWYGDLDLSGSVTDSDLTALNAGNGSSWATGDLNYDGVKNADDYALFQLGAAMQNGSITAGVPEPTALGLVAIPMLMGMRRRRR